MSYCFLSFLLLRIYTLLNIKFYILFTFALCYLLLTFSHSGKQVRYSDKHYKGGVIVYGRTQIDAIILL
jgi:hypothetical protein